VPASRQLRLAFMPVFLTGAALSAIAGATGAQMTRHLAIDIQVSVVLLNFAYWTIWTLLTPAVLWLGMRWQFASGQRVKALAIHAFAGVAVALLHIVLLTIAQAAIRAAVTDKTWPQAWTAMRLPTRMQIEWEITTYWALVGLAHAIAYKREADRRAITAAQLEAKLARAQSRALQQQLQPHFMFNTLQTISALVRHDAPAAERVLERFSDLLRQTLRAGDHMEVPLGEELEHTRTYVEIVQTNMGDRLRVRINVPDDLLCAAVPALLLQPLVENAVRHGLAPRARGGTIVIDGQRRGDTLQLRVVDDGIGFAGDITGIGLQNTTISVPYRRLFAESPEGAACRV
jgi:two-component system LytT family sensor kinase